MSRIYKSWQLVQNSALQFWVYRLLNKYVLEALKFWTNSWISDIRENQLLVHSIMHIMQIVRTFSDLLHDLTIHFNQIRVKHWEFHYFSIMSLLAVHDWNRLGRPGAPRSRFLQTGNTWQLCRKCATSVDPGDPIMPSHSGHLAQDLSVMRSKTWRHSMHGSFVFLVIQPDNDGTFKAGSCKNNGASALIWTNSIILMHPYHHKICIYHIALIMISTNRIVLHTIILNCDNFFYIDVHLPHPFRSWEFGVPVMENFIPASMVWDAIATKHD